MALQSEAQEPAKIKILLIAHQEPFLKRMRNLLAQWGFGVSTGHVGIDAIHKVRENPPDVLILEEEMPGLTAIETAKRIRAFNQRLPIFILTENIYKTTSEESRKLGITGFIPKELVAGKIGAAVRLSNLQTSGIFQFSTMIKEVVKMKEKEDVSASHKENSKAGKKKLLVVEDEPSTLITIKDRLEFEGYEVVTAEDGEIALSEAREEKPNLIILDIMLPKMDGFKVCRLLKFDENFRHIPIIMPSARVQDTDKQLGKETGADEYIAKPFDFDELLKKIKELIK